MSKYYECARALRHKKFTIFVRIVDAALLQ